MLQGVYLESSVVDLKPNVLDFLKQMVEKAKSVTDFALSFKKKELAEATGKDSRTITRYLTELEKRNIIEMKGVRGRNGGTVILFNTDLIRFDTSDKAWINSDEKITLDEVVQKKMPKKPKKEPKRNRRTQAQIAQDNLLKSEQEKRKDALNQEVADLGGTPNWEWFQKTDNPVGNYRTYLLTRLYNRYAVLFTDEHIGTMMVEGKDCKIKRITNDYDVLPEKFFGSSRWQQFEKFREFCEENHIEPAVYLSAQFSRSVFTAANNNSKVLPFVNALLGDSSYEVYQQYCDYQARISQACATYKIFPIKFAEDFVVRALEDAYKSADTQLGLLPYRHAITDFFSGEGVTDEEDHLYNFYRLTNKKLRKQNVSKKTREVIKKFVLLQSLIQTGGVARLPVHLILGSEHTRVVLASVRAQADRPEQAIPLQEVALGVLTHPLADEEIQIERGKSYQYQMNVLDETPRVLRLIMERTGLHLSLQELQAAFKEYGRDNLPLDDRSVLDIDKIIAFMKENAPPQEEIEDINLEDATTKSEWELVGEVQEGYSTIDEALEAFLSGETK
jgi:hypothetical protein